MDYNKILYSEISFKPANNGNNYQINQNEQEFQTPRLQLCDPNLVRLDWTQSEKVGAGLINVGNTCFLNSVLQCLTYCPPLYNFLVKLNGGHSTSCKLNQFCMLCEMEKHVRKIRASNGTPVKPVAIVQRLKYISKSFQYGRQEDAHEFLRYLIDHMWKACLSTSSNNGTANGKATKLDPKIKETTIINHIFGGYHRSQVWCLSCNTRSNTYDFFMDFILDIKNAKSLEEALRKFTQPETLENENAYKCGKCRKKVTARKKFTVFKAPNVATFQLKRFDSDRIFGGKVTKFITYPEQFDLRPYMSDTSKSSIIYRLSAVLVHVGHSSNSGHYFCFIRNSNGFWYRMDDSHVSMVSEHAVLQQQAYVLFYVRKSSDSKQPSNGVSQESYKLHKPTNGVQNELSKSSRPSNGTSHESFKPCKPSSTIADESITPIKLSNGTTQDPSKTHKTSNGSFSSFTTWSKTKSQLDVEDSNKRKLNEITDRDKFNEELDQGKTKKIKSFSRDDRFWNIAKSNPFQRFTNNNKRNNRWYNGRQYNDNNTR